MLNIHNDINLNLNLNLYNKSFASEFKFYVAESVNHSLESNLNSDLPCLTHLCILQICIMAST